MKRAAKRKKSSSANSGSIRRTPQTVEAIENVFRSTHQREMTEEERRRFRLPLAENEPRMVTDSGQGKRPKLPAKP